MNQHTLTPDFDLLNTILDDLTEKTAGLPVSARKQIEPGVNQLKYCLGALNAKSASRSQAAAAAAYQAMLLDSVHDVVIAMDPQMRITLWNRNAEALSGVSAKDALGKNFYDLARRDMVTIEEREADRRTLDQNGVMLTENTYLGSDGRRVTLESVNIVLRGLDGQITGYLVTSRDISDRKEAEAALQANAEALKTNAEALRESEAALQRSLSSERARTAELEALMDAVPVSIWIAHDSQGQRITGNRRGYELLRMAPGENLSKTAPNGERSRQTYQIMNDGQPVPAEDLPMQRAARGEPARDYEFDIVFEDGEVRQMLGNATPLFDSSGQPCGAIGAFADITTLRMLEAQQIEAKTQLEVQRRLMENREQERQGIALDLHDGPIQTLASTAFNVQFLKESFQDPTLRIELEQIGLNIKSAIRELREIVNDLRPPSLIRFGLTKAIQMHSEDIRERHPELNIELDLFEGPNPLSEQACLTLFRVYQEGLNNVIRHSAAAHVWVSYRVEEGRFTLDLSDDGHGFTLPADWSTLTRAGHFGLAGMKERAETVGAEFIVNSAPGKGATIRMSGPVAP